jgi:hypothetical protein
VVENPGLLLVFVPRVGVATWLLIPALLSRQVTQPLILIIGQVVKTFFRGLPAVLVLGVGLAVGYRYAAIEIGPLAEPIFERAVVRLLVQKAIPLVLAIFLAARTGATLAAKFGIMPLVGGLPRGRFAPADIRDHVLPNLVAGAVTAAAFHGIVLVVAGQLVQTTAAVSAREARQPWLETPTLWREGWGNGALISGAFGFLVAYTGSALGVAAGERYHPR